MNNELKAKNYISRYIATTYIVFWIGILLVGSIFLLVNNDLITDIDGEKGPDFPLNIQCIKDGIESFPSFFFVRK